MSRCGWLQSTTVWLEAIEWCYNPMYSTIFFCCIKLINRGRRWRKNLGGFLHHDRPVHLSFRAWHHVMLLRSFKICPPYYTISKSLVHRSIRHARFHSHRIHQIIHSRQRQTPDPNGMTDRLFLPVSCATHALSGRIRYNHPLTGQTKRGIPSAIVAENQGKPGQRHKIKLRC